LDFWLKMLSSTSQPGARILGSVGDAGQSVLSTVRGDLDRSRQTNEARRKEYMDNVRAEMGFVNTDADNVRADQRGAAEERKWIATDKKDQAKLDLMRQELDQAGKKVSGHIVLGNGNIGLITQGGIVETKYKAKAPQGHAVPGEIQLIDRLTRDPNAFEMWKKMHPERSEKGIDPLAVVKAGTDAAKLDMTGKTTVDTGTDAILRNIARVRGGGAIPPNSIKRGSQDWKDTLADPKIGGDEKKLEAVLKSRGIEITK